MHYDIKKLGDLQVEPRKNTKARSPRFGNPNDVATALAELDEFALDMKGFGTIRINSAPNIIAIRPTKQFEKAGWFMRFPEVAFRLPDWLSERLGDSEHVFSGLQERMDFVIELSRLNFERSKGGAFAAAVFEAESGRLVAPGVNMVLAADCSIAHAEIMAIAVAHRIAGCFDLGDDRVPHCELVTSTEPCAMCMGAVVWSGGALCAARATRTHARSDSTKGRKEPTGSRRSKPGESPSCATSAAGRPARCRRSTAATGGSSTTAAKWVVRAEGGLRRRSGLCGVGPAPCKF